MRNIAAVVTSTLAVLSCAWATPDAPKNVETRPPAERLLRSEVRVGNKVVLRGTASDDGTPDADEVWSMAHTVKLYPTEDFADLKASADAEEFMVLGTPIPPDGRFDNPVHETDVVFKISSGGEFATMALQIEKVDVLFGKSWWKVPREALQLRSTTRLVPRYLVAKLKKPLGKK